MSILIAGAGLGGLTLGAMLHAQGQRFRMFEAAEAFDVPEIGMLLRPEAMMLLDRLGLMPALAEIGIPLRQVAWYDGSGRGERVETLSGSGWTHFATHQGHLRLRLLHHLLERAGAGWLELGAALEGWREDGGAVEIALRDRIRGRAGGAACGSLLIAADGEGSVARRHLHPAEPRPRLTNRMIWRGLTPARRLGDGRSCVVITGQGRRFICFPIADLPNGGSLVNWLAESPLPEAEELSLAQGPDVLFDDWRFDWLNVPRLIAGTGEVQQHPTRERNPLPFWQRGRVALMGDAAHPMYQIGAYGATQAMLDAASLSQSIAVHGPTVQSLQSYEAERLPRLAANRLASVLSQEARHAATLLQRGLPTSPAELQRLLGAAPPPEAPLPGAAELPAMQRAVDLRRGQG